MKKITVNLPCSSYDILIANGLIHQAGELIRKIAFNRQIVVVTDEIVDKHYGDQFIDNLVTAGLEPKRVIIPPGEASKSIAMLERLYGEFIQAKLTRSDCVVALGGGVVGDLTGFAAATYLRGVQYIHVPTTLLAQVDSSVGGKVAVNLPQGKNLVGAFHQPAAVLIDPELLNSLSARALNDGMAEALKYGAIADKVLFEQLAACRTREEFMDQAVAVISSCCRIKRDIVEEDEKDTGKRMVLNFGHTIGHAVEQIGKYQTYTHGEAVAIGMVKISELSEQRGFSRLGTTAELRDALVGHGLPVETKLWDKAGLLKAMSADKKNTASGIQLIILREIGRAEVVRLSLEEVAAALL